MKYFIRHIVLFLLIFSAILVLTDVVFSGIVDRRSDFRLKGNPEYVILGHSHPECAFNDSLIDGFHNYAQSGETYFYTYHKAKKLLEQNPSIHTVFIGFTNNQITRAMDTWTWGDEYLSYRYPSYSPFLSVNEKFLLFRSNPGAFLNSASVSMQKRFSQVFSNDFFYGDQLGAYLYLDRIKTMTAPDDSRTDQTEQSGISALNLAYLDKLIELCTMHGTRVILLRSPLHPTYPGLKNEADFLNTLSDRYAGLEFLDLSMFPLEDHEFADLEHLNYNGARVFSLWFGDMLGLGLLSREDKQAFVESQLSLSK